MFDEANTRRGAVPKVPEYQAILDDPEWQKYSNCCPTCHKYPGEPTESGAIRFPCGSVYDLHKNVRDVRCNETIMDVNMALYEAASIHYVFAELETQLLDRTGEPADYLQLTTPPIFLRNGDPVSYLLWDTDVLMSVLDGLEKAIGTVPEHLGDMNMVWVSNRDVFEREFVILGWFIHADYQGIMGGQAVQFRDQFAGDPVILWHRTVRWGVPITNQEDASTYLAYSWLHQPYVNMAEGIQHSRPVRRDAERRGKTLGNIKVIEFRKVQSQHTGQSDNTEAKRELHCCFERTGYSRRQPYGPKSTLRRIQWIAPTLVGDPSKPFKPKGQTLFRVTR